MSNSNSFELAPAAPTGPGARSDNTSPTRSNAPTDEARNYSPATNSSSSSSSSSTPDATTAFPIHTPTTDESHRQGNAAEAPRRGTNPDTAPVASASVGTSGPSSYSSSSSVSSCNGSGSGLPASPGRTQDTTPPTHRHTSQPSISEVGGRQMEMSPTPSSASRHVTPTSASAGEPSASHPNPDASTGVLESESNSDSPPRATSSPERELKTEIPCIKTEDTGEDTGDGGFGGAGADGFPPGAPPQPTEKFWERSAETARKKFRPSKDRPYVCRHCYLTFAQKGNCNVHEKLHSDVRRFQCEACSKTFARRQTLTTHMLIHSKSRPHKCPAPGCDHAFAQKSQRDRHFRTHSGFKPFPCKCCARRYCDKRNLIAHIERDHKELASTLVPLLRIHERVRPLSAGGGGGAVRKSRSFSENRRRKKRSSRSRSSKTTIVKKEVGADVGEAEAASTSGEAASTVQSDSSTESAAPIRKSLRISARDSQRDSSNLSAAAGCDVDGNVSATSASAIATDGGDNSRRTSDGPSGVDLRNYFMSGSESGAGKKPSDSTAPEVVAEKHANSQADDNRANASEESQASTGTRPTPEVSLTHPVANNERDSKDAAPEDAAPAGSRENKEEMVDDDEAEFPPPTPHFLGSAHSLSVMKELLSGGPLSSGLTFEREMPSMSASSSSALPMDLTMPSRASSSTSSSSALPMDLTMPSRASSSEVVESAFAFANEAKDESHSFGVFSSSMSDESSSPAFSHHSGDNLLQENTFSDLSLSATPMLPEPFVLERCASLPSLAPNASQSQNANGVASSPFQERGSGSGSGSFAEFMPDPNNTTATISSGTTPAQGEMKQPPLLRPQSSPPHFGASSSAVFSPSLFAGRTSSPSISIRDIRPPHTPETPVEALHRLTLKGAVSSSASLTAGASSASGRQASLPSLTGGFSSGSLPLSHDVGIPSLRNGQMPAESKATFLPTGQITKPVQDTYVHASVSQHRTLGFGLNGPNPYGAAAAGTFPAATTAAAFTGSLPAGGDPRATAGVANATQRAFINLQHLQAARAMASGNAGNVANAMYAHATAAAAMQRLGISPVQVLMAQREQSQQRQRLLLMQYVTQLQRVRQQQQQQQQQQQGAVASSQDQ